MNERIEHDSMGEVRVPADRLYGAQTQRSIAHFPIDERMPLPIVHALVRIKAAAAAANAALGVLTQEQGDAIGRAADAILSGGYEQEFPLSVFQTGSGSQTNMNVNEVIAALAARSGTAIHPNDHVNRGQSTNDVFPSAIHIAVVCETEHALLPAIDRMAAALDSCVARFSGTVKLGRTHLMDATPITLGQEFSAYREALAQTRRMLVAAMEPLRALALGGTAVGTGLNAHPELGRRTAALLSEALSTPFTSADNKFHALSCRDGLVFYHGAVKALASDLMKMASDIRLLSSGPRGGIGELVLPANEPGSSIMPGKVNPTQCEQLFMVCIRTLGNDAAIGVAASQGQLQLNTCLPLLGSDTLQSIRLLSAAMGGFTAFCLSGIRANEPRIRENLENSLMLVTALTPRLGYEAAARIANEAHLSGVTLKKAALDSGLLTETEYDAIVRPASMV